MSISSSVYKAMAVVAKPDHIQWILVAVVMVTMYLMRRGAYMA
jgi:hypothetical protein